MTDDEKLAEIKVALNHYEDVLHDLWNNGPRFVTPANAEQARATLLGMVERMRAERDRYHDALIARHGGGS